MRPRTLAINFYLGSHLWAALASIFCALPAQAGIDPPTIRPQISAASGISIGTIVVDQSGSDAESIVFGTTKKKTYKVGGFPASLTLLQNITPKLTMAYGGHMMFDVGNRQVLSIGGLCGAAWHLLGGATEVIDGTKDFTIAYQESYNLSLIAQVLGSNYSSQVLGAEFKGLAIETRLGLEYRHNLTRRFAIGGDAVTTVFSMAASSPNIAPKMTEIVGFLRYLP